ncbi:MAG: transcription antitermination factor NusB [Chloroflexi bacterium]|nr:transcription antitermination factor NusB [Chloroflexota bacterium]MDA1297388.1 transcription antitermination factor NusB [Chloroflexota bacterium]
MTSQTVEPDPTPANLSTSETGDAVEPAEPQPKLPEPPEPELTDKLDRLAGGRTVSEETPLIPRGARGARAAALQALFEEDLTGHPALRALQHLPAFLGLSPTQAKRAETIVRRVSATRHALDERIAGAARQYPVQQMGTVDRNVLRIALAELDSAIGTPAGVVVNEAVEIARLFGSESSPGFVNGVLGALLR